MGHSRVEPLDVAPITEEERADLERIAAELRRLIALMKHVEQMWRETPQLTYLQASIRFAQDGTLTWLEDNLANQKLTFWQIYASLSGFWRGLAESGPYVVDEDPEISALVSKITEGGRKGVLRARESDPGPLPC